jgi:hypothetical protein
VAVGLIADSSSLEAIAGRHGDRIGVWNEFKLRQLRFRLPAEPIDPQSTYQVRRNCPSAIGRLSSPTDSNTGICFLMQKLHRLLGSPLMPRSHPLRRLMSVLGLLVMSRPHLEEACVQRVVAHRRNLTPLGTRASWDRNLDLLAAWPSLS